MEVAVHGSFVLQCATGGGLQVEGTVGEVVDFGFGGGTAVVGLGGGEEGVEGGGDGI